MTNREAFQKNLKSLLAKNNYNQSDLCKYLGITNSTVSSWVTGKAYPRTDTIERIAKFFGCSVFELVCENESDEDKLLHAFRILSPYGKKEALKRIDELTHLYWYDKERVL